MNPVNYSELTLVDSVPVSQQFDDSYFSREDGIAESEYVFLTHNRLNERWQNGKTFCIGELGFGTGLNFFLTLKLWQQNRKPGQICHYYSVEKYPIRLGQLQAIHRQWPQFQPHYQQFYQNYPNNLPGHHIIEYAELGLILHLMIGDAVEMYSQVVDKMDAWYLDGFSPAKNETMWSETCFSMLAERSKAGSSFATFTAAGFVRRGLNKVGFEVFKVAGFGKKREMLCGRYEAKAHFASSSAPWFSLNFCVQRPSKNVAVIGAGIAGLSTAWYLQKQGIKVSVFEENHQVASGASGNPCGLVMPRHTNDFSLDSQFYYTCLTQSTQFYNTLKQRYPALNWQQTGVVQLVDSSQLSKIESTGYPDNFLQIKSAEEISVLVNLGVSQPGMYFPNAGYISPVQLCETLFQDLQDKVIFNFDSTVHGLAFDGEQWHVKTSSSHQMFDAIVLANSFAANDLIGLQSIHLEKNRGQLSILDQESDALNISQLTIPLVYNAYLTPTLNGQQMLGASYAPDAQLTARLKDHKRNIDKLNSVLSVPEVISPEQLGNRISFRAYSQDRMPIVGPVHDETWYRSVYWDLHHGKRYKTYPDAKYLPGLYVNIGHGSRGLVSAIPSACMIAGLIVNSPVNMPNNIIARLHSARFLIRQLKKQVDAR